MSVAPVPVLVNVYKPRESSTKDELSPPEPKLTTVLPDEFLINNLTESDTEF